MTQVTFGNANPLGSDIPDLYIQVQNPPSAALSGVPTDIIGIVGTSSWGPVNSPVAFSDEAGGGAAFAPMANRKYDLMTQAHAAIMQGAKNFRGVRVTDGTDAAATATIQTNGGTLTAKYTGSRGNGLQMVISAGTANATKKVTLSIPGLQPEIFDNIGGTANASWLNIAAAINTGQANGRGPSQLAVFAAGASTTTAAVGTSTASGGLDGATTITGTVMIGADTVPRSGMYALRNVISAGNFLLADCDDSTTWAAQLAFAKSELAYAIAVGPSGDTIANQTTVINGAAIDDPWIKVCFGDWVYMSDGVNGLVRKVSPQGFFAGCKAVIGPQNSTLNKPMYGIVGTEKSYANQVYSTAELALLAAARSDVITIPSVGGAYPSARFGRSSSSDKSRQQETYTGMTNFLAASLGVSSGLGLFVGRLITPTEMREAKNCIGGFLQGLWDGGLIGNSQGTIPYSVQVDAANNPPSQVALGVQVATVNVQYLSVLEKFLVNLTGGATVQIVSQQPLAA